MLDAKIASVLNKIIQNSQFKKKLSFEEWQAPKEDGNFEQVRFYPLWHFGFF